MIVKVNSKIKKPKTENNKKWKKGQHSTQQLQRKVKGNFTYLGF